MGLWLLAAGFVVFVGLGEGFGAPAGEAGAGGGGGLGAEDGDVVGGAAEVGTAAGEIGEREVAAEFADELLGGPGREVLGEFGGVDAVEQFEPEGGDFGARRVTVDGVFDGAQDVAAVLVAFGVAGGGLGGGLALAGGDGGGEVVVEG